MADATKNQHVGSFPPDKKITVVFVLGGPGSGKGTQCTKIANQFQFTHLSAGELLREEAKSNTEQGVMIKNLMHEGKLVPSEIIVRLLLKAMLQTGSDRFLVDGFPRNEENRQAYEKICRSESFCIGNKSVVRSCSILSDPVVRVEEDVSVIYPLLVLSFALEQRRLVKRAVALESRRRRRFLGDGGRRDGDGGGAFRQRSVSSDRI